MGRFGLFLLGAVFFSAVQADSLMQVYRQAVQSDPTFAQAQSTWHSQQMNLPIARAGYLPQVGVTGSAGRYYNANSPVNLGGFPYESWQYNYGLTLSQPIFDVATWEQIKGASATVKSATATYLAAEQSLMQRTAQAYFAVLQAYDQLRYTIANKNAVWQQYVTSHQQFEVGLIAVTDEYDAKSRYDEVVAKQIAAQNNLNIQLENLRAITGHDYKSLKGIARQLPLFTPQPNNIEKWVTVAERQNYAVKSQRFAELAAMDNIKQQAAGGYPSLDLTGGASKGYTRYSGTPDQINTAANLGLSLTYNPIQGGLVLASTKQAEYDYVTASAALEQSYRQTIDQTRSSFLSVLSYISQVKADKASIVSARKALAATEAGLKVGTRTMVDVLNDLSALYLSQQAYADDQYAYLNNLIALKAAAGTLSERDLEKINSWLQQPISFPEKTSVSDISVDQMPSAVLPKKSATQKIVRKHKKVAHKKHRSLNRKKIVPKNKTKHVVVEPTLTAPAMLPAPKAVSAPQQQPAVSPK